MFITCAFLATSPSYFDAFQVFRALDGFQGQRHSETVPIPILSKNQTLPGRTLKENMKTWISGIIQYPNDSKGTILKFFVWFWTSLTPIRSINLHPARRSFYLGASKKFETHGQMLSADKCGKWSAAIRVWIALSRNRVLPELTGALDSPFPEFSQHLMEEDLTDKMTCSIYQQVINKKNDCFQKFGDFSHLDAPLYKIRLDDQFQQLSELNSCGRMVRGTCLRGHF